MFSLKAKAELICLKRYILRLLLLLEPEVFGLLGLKGREGDEDEDDGRELAFVAGEIALEVFRLSVSILAPCSKRLVNGESIGIFDTFSRHGLGKFLIIAFLTSSFSLISKFKDLSSNVVSRYILFDMSCNSERQT
jgi:hypothetical protein